MRKGKVQKFKVQHFIDIQTSAESMQIINFSVGGVELMRRCAHLIGAYRYFKLGSIKVKFCAASSLPMDPLGLSYDDDDPQTVDPRDQLSPGLVRITNGEDILTDITGMSAEVQDRVYQAMMLDPRWYKFGLQSGFQRTARPLWYQIGQYHQDVYPGAIQNLPYIRHVDGVGTVPAINENTDVLHRVGYGTGSDADFNGSGTSQNWVHRFGPDSDPHGFFQTGQRGRFGWLRTDAYQELASPDGIIHRPLLTPFPEVRCITAVLPKMRKTSYFYRVYITETVYFSGVRHFSPSEGLYGSVTDSALDDFARVYLFPKKPGEGVAPIVSPQYDYNSGGDDDSE